MYALACVGAFVCACVCMNVRVTRVCTYVGVCACVRACMCVCVRACACARVCVTSQQTSTSVSAVLVRTEGAVKTKSTVTSVTVQLATSGITAKQVTSLFERMSLYFTSIDIQSFLFGRYFGTVIF